MPSRTHHWWAWAALFVLVIVRVTYAFCLEVNSDEPQHLHVVWAWTQGLLPFRDVFDNHAPLFAFLYSPLLRVLGERADIVPLMRVANFPWYAIALWATYRVGCAAFDRWVGIAAVAITATESTFFLKSVEFRPDAMWAAIWMLALALGMKGTMNVRRAFSAGLLVGLACAVSIKTSVLLVSGLAASVVLFGLIAYEEGTVAWNPWMRIGTASAAGLAVVPLVVIFSFAFLGAFPAMRYCLVEHNLAPGLGRWSSDSAWRMLLPLLVALPLIHGAYALLRHGAERERAARRAWLLLTCGAYLVLRDAYQPLLTGQDLLPWVPMASLFVAAGIRWLVDMAAAPGIRSVARNAAIATVSSAALMFVGDRHPPWKDDAGKFSRKLETILTLTKLDSAVLDGKGESIYRPRATYWVFENVTLYRFATGLIRDDVSARLASCRIAVVVGDNWPQGLNAFIRNNYLARKEGISVAGMRLDQVLADVPISFDIAVPQTYDFRSAGAPFVGSIDGVPYSGSRALPAGEHSLVSSRTGPVELEWAGTAADPCLRERYSPPQESISMR